MYVTCYVGFSSSRWNTRCSLLTGFHTFTLPIYDTRPNLLYVEFLKQPQEVFGMIWKRYKAVILGAVAALAVFAWTGWQLFANAAPDQLMTWWLRPVFTLVAGALIFLAIRGTLGHRPITPSSVAYCGDSMLNTLPLNSLYRSDVSTSHLQSLMRISN